MRKRSLLLGFAAVVALSTAARANAAQDPTLGQPVEAAVLEGRVLKPDGRSCERALVELKSDGTSTVARTYTDGSGRYRFNVPTGNYVVEVDPVTDPGLARQAQRIEINPSPFARGNEIFRLDFKLRAAAERSGASLATGTRFVQEVPAGARDEYSRGVKLLKDNPEEALNTIRKALDLFPDYYDALETLGSEYVKGGQLEAALPLLEKAVQINPSGEKSHYALGVLYYKTSQYQKAVGSFERASQLGPSSPNTTLFLGLAQMRAGQSADAETTLKRAYSLGATKVPELHLALTSIYVKENRTGDAAKQLRTLLKECPNLKDKDKIKALIEKYEK